MLIPKRILEARWYPLLGAFIFWVPDVVLHTLRGTFFSWKDVLFLTLFLPLIGCLVPVLIWKRSPERQSRAPEAFAAVAGIWVLGPPMMLLGWIPAGSPRVGFVSLLKCVALFPACTYMMSTYDGTLFALLITTVSLPLLAISPLIRGRSGDRP